MTVVPGRVQFLGGTDNAMRHVQIDRAFNLKGTVPNLGAEVPSWLGETVGFWDGDTLITWTSNIQGWFTHSSWEYSSRMQLIEIWTPRRFADGRFAGLEHETVFYDPEAFVQPVRDIRFFSRRGDYKDAAPFHLEHCNQTIFVGEDGRGTQVPPGTTIQYKVRDSVRPSMGPHLGRVFRERDEAARRSRRPGRIQVRRAMTGVVMLAASLDGESSCRSVDSLSHCGSATQSGRQRRHVRPDAADCGRQA